MRRGSPSNSEYTTIPPPGSRGRESGGIQIQLKRWERRSLERTLRKTKDARLAKRCQIVLLRSRSWLYREIAETVGVSVGTVQRVLKRYRDYGQAGLIDRREDNGQVKVDGKFLGVLWEVLEHSPSSYRWPRPTWTIEMLIQTMAEKTGVKVSRSTMSRALHAIGARRGRPKPIVLCPWSKASKARRLAQIRRIIENLSPGEVAVWADEVDVDLNPKIGADWMLPGQQRHVLTPGRNEKEYIAGAMDAGTRRLVWVKGKRKDSLLFIHLLLKLCEEYPTAHTIHVIVDNFKIHTSQQTMKTLQQMSGRIRLHFLPPYSPDDNPIERFWRDFHDNVTRNHRYKTMRWLMWAAERYLHEHNRKFPRWSNVRQAA